MLSIASKLRDPFTSIHSWREADHGVRAMKTLWDVAVALPRSLSLPLPLKWPLKWQLPLPLPFKSPLSAPCRRCPEREKVRRLSERNAV